MILDQFNAQERITLETMIGFSGVTQGFGHKTPIKDERRVVLDNVSIQIDKGEIVCLLGPSG